MTEESAPLSVCVVVCVCVWDVNCVCYSVCVYLCVFLFIIVCLCVDSPVMSDFLNEMFDKNSQSFLFLLQLKFVGICCPLVEQQNMNVYSLSLFISG